MKINKEFCTYEQSLALKKLGFDEPCFAFYNQDNDLEAFETIFVCNEDNINSKLPDINDYFYKDEEITIDFCTAPLKQQVFKWFREKHLLEALILPQDRGAVLDGEPLYFIAIISYKNEEMKELFNSTNEKTLLHYNPYEEAELACIDKLIEIVKNERTT